MNPISVLLVDDNATFLRIATRLLQGQSDVVVVGTAGGGEEVLAQGQGLQIVSKIPGLRGNLYPLSSVGQRPEAKAVGLKEQSPMGYFGPQRGYALSARGFTSRAVAERIVTQHK